MTAWPSTVSLRTFPMNDADIPDQDEMLGSDPARKAAKSPRPRSRAQRRWGGRVLALGAFLLLTTGISLGASRHYAQQRQALATADEARRFAPAVLVAPVEASTAFIPVTLPGTTAAFAAANIYARPTGYISRRNVDIGAPVHRGDLLAEFWVPESKKQISHKKAKLPQLTASG